MGATNNSIASNFFLGMANVVYPAYIIERWHTVLLAYCVAFLSAGVNLWVSYLLHKISKFILIWNVPSFVIITVTLLATTSTITSSPYRLCFKTSKDTAGLGTAVTAIVGILQACFGMCCYDGPSHMTEEMNSATTEAPKTIILAVCLGTVTGFAFSLTLCFCIGDIAATAQSSTGVPVIQIMDDSTGSKVATCILASLIAVIVTVAGVNILAEGSRSTFAFARDHGLPFSPTCSKVERKSQVPVNAVFLTLAVQLALGAIEFGTVTGLPTVVSISTAGFWKYHLFFLCPANPYPSIRYG
ncbi:hypothetical protein N7539_002076 [Penicillium diatomitis]|uniref:Uncharacterized protein n=1 Tax=Penicillium diatomitis TaxID=2819901 RepID=A0A9X0C0P0_9EURO|nr:uncharacterized protein N7539_002076 [Penicillium diatomitis]KAJ5493330.1 hypothetical protein N7539_002076 [Penicillium diatomitis]